MSEEIESISQNEICCKSVTTLENSSQEFFKINENFVQTVDFEGLTVEWILSKLLDYDLKILRIEKCVNIKTALDHLNKLDIGRVNNLFVLVLEFLEKLKTPTELEVGYFAGIFRDYRPFVLQFNSSNGKTVFFKNYLELKFTTLSTHLTTKFMETPDLRHILKAQGKFTGDIKTAKISKIGRTICAEDVVKNVLCLRFINLFNGGCARIMPWLTPGYVMELNCTKLYIAYLDYPFRATAAVELAWQFRRITLLKNFLARDCPFPKNFNIERISPRNREKIEKVLVQRQQLHKSIAEGNVENVSTILEEIEADGGTLKYLFSQSNESAMATALKHLNFSIYARLLQKKLRFCEKCVQLIQDLPESARKVMKDINFKCFTPIKTAPDMHNLLSNCFLATGHLKNDYFSKKINKFFCEIEENPKTSQLLRIVKKVPALRIVFDFKHAFIGMMDPSDETKHFTFGLCYNSGILYIAGKRKELYVKGTLIHEIAHLSMQVLYRNEAKPFRYNDEKRIQEFTEAVSECAEVYKKKDKVVDQTINHVFQRYLEDKFAIELIARVPEVVITCPKEEAESVQAMYPKLFTYYFKYISSDIDDAFSETSNKIFHQINRKYIQSVDFKDLTKEWMNSKKLDNNLKVLVCRKCSNLLAVSDLLRSLDISSVNNLFVIVLEIQEHLVPATKNDIKLFMTVFKDDRPLLMQIDTPSGFKAVYVKHCKGGIFHDLSLPYKSTFNTILEAHGFFEGDILTTKICSIPAGCYGSKTMANSVLCLRFLNIFEGGCTRIMPWLNDSCFLALKFSNIYFAYIDYPFRPQVAVELAWQLQKCDLLKIFLAMDCPFPKDFNVEGIAQIYRENFKKILDQRHQLHESIAEGNVDKVSTILKEIEASGGKLEHLFSQSNESAMATALKHFSANIYALLLQKRLRFCEKCVQLMKNLPENTRRAIRDMNKTFFVQTVTAPDRHKLLSNCFVATGHLNHEYYTEKINNFLWQLEKLPETSQLLRVAWNMKFLKIVFDFRHSFVGMMIPSSLQLFNCFAYFCNGSNIFYVSGNMNHSIVLGSFAQILAVSAMQLLYKNISNPFCQTSVKRMQEFHEVIDECKDVYERKEKIDVQTINDIFQNFPEDNIASQLISSVPKMLIQFDNHDVETVKMKYPKLFDFYFKYFVVDIESNYKEILKQHCYKLNQNYVQSIEYKNLTAEWINSKKFDNDLKVLQIKNCPNIEAASLKMTEIDMTSLNSLFVLILQFQDLKEEPTTSESNMFSKVFKDSRPVILQLNLPSFTKGNIFVKDYLQSEFQVLSDNVAMNELFYVRGYLSREILLSRLPQMRRLSWSEGFAKNVLCLRVINLFKFGCRNILYWLKPGSVERENNLQLVLAFNDYPFESQAALELARKLRRFDLVEIIHDGYSSSDFNPIIPKYSEECLEALAQLENIHQISAYHNIQEITLIFDTVLKKRASNDSMMQTVQKNLIAYIYTLLFKI